MNEYIGVGLIIMVISFIITINVIDCKKRIKMSAFEKRQYLKSIARIPGDW